MKVDLKDAELNRYLDFKDWDYQLALNSTAGIYNEWSGS